MLATDPACPESRLRGSKTAANAEVSHDFGGIVRLVCSVWTEERLSKVRVRIECQSDGTPYYRNEATEANQGREKDAYTHRRHIFRARPRPLRDDQLLRGPDQLHRNPESHERQQPCSEDLVESLWPVVQPTLQLAPLLYRLPLIRQPETNRRGRSHGRPNLPDTHRSRFMRIAGSCLAAHEREMNNLATVNSEGFGFDPGTSK